jgi:predicted DsbA family dithiol-disulfide isomerase
MGIQSVPTLVINGKYVIQGSQSPDTYADLLQKIAIEP